MAAIAAFCSPSRPRRLTAELKSVAAVEYAPNPSSRHRSSPPQVSTLMDDESPERVVLPLAALEPFSRGEEVRVWRPSHLQGLELMTAVHSNRLWRVFHETYVACLLPRRRHDPPSDAVDWWYRGRQHVMRPGTVALMEPGEVHANTRNYRDTDFFALFFDPESLRSAAEDLSIRGPVHWRVPGTESPQTRAAVCRLYAALADGMPPLEQETRLAACLRVLLESCSERRPAARPREHPGVRRARDYLHAYPLQQVRLDDLAIVSGVSRYHLVRVFTRTYGLSPHAYQNQLRIACVRRHLRAGIPLRDIETGFFDQSHLIRHFKRVVGVSPGQYASSRAASLPRFF